MRYSVVCTSFLLATIAVSSLSLRAGEQNGRWTAVVVADETPLLSAPADDAYATDLAKTGSEFEVIRREPGGWLAIRPPQGSFSWIPARKLRWTPGSPTAEVVTDDAVAWIGSRVETVRSHKWLVRLRRGETIQVLGSRELVEPQTRENEIWCQIVPPAGEFRWIHQADVREKNVPRDALADDSAVGPVANGERQERRPVHAAGFFAERAAKRRSAGLPQPPASLNALLQSRQAGAIDEPPAMAPNMIPTAAPPLEGNPPPTAPTNTPALSARQFDRELEDISLQLSLMVPKDPNLWNLAGLHDRAERLVDAGGSPVDRGRARLMIEKIEQFEQLQQQYASAERTSAAPLPSVVGTDVAAAARAARAPGGTAPEPRFDGSGWLLPVHSTKRVAPPYALMDDKGQVVQYVTPAPGVNLHRYERKRVGVYGQKGVASSLNAPMITAHRIVDLDRLTR